MVRSFHANKIKSDPEFAVHPWRIIEEEFSPETNHHNEAIFSLGNGYMGLRGTIEEDYSGPRETTTPGFYINGIYDSEEIVYGEEAPNLPKYSQTIVNLMDWTGINLFLGEEKLDLFVGQVKDYQRVLDMRTGVLSRKFTWVSPQGKKIKIEIERLISYTNKELALIDYRVTPLNFTGELKIESGLDGRVRNRHHFRKDRVMEVDSAGFANGRCYMLQRTSSSGIEVAGAVKNKLSAPSRASINRDHFIVDEEIIEHFRVFATRDETYRLKKFAAFATSRDVPLERLRKQVIIDVNRGAESGVEELKNSQKKFLEDFWNDFDVFLRGQKSLQQAMRFNAFQLMQSTGSDGKTNVPAKGLTGEFYEGHYFWDTETFIVPFYLFNRPQIARKLLEYRYYILEKARQNARRVRLNGALFPWRTINGDEASGFFMGSTVQYHIDADIAYAIYLYYTTTEDREFLHNMGAEILAETARMWVSCGHFDKNTGEFCFNEVCGPDEYKPGVDNNCFTNYMACFNLKFARRTLMEMKDEAPDKYRRLKEKINFEEKELQKWQEAAEYMYLPFDEERNIHPQDDSFLKKEPLDIESIPHEELPLVANWHPLTIWRYQVIKQADVILLMLLQGDKFSLEEKKANYDFYEPRTTHDSSLSPAVYSIIASEIGYVEEAFDYFVHTCRLDLDDFHENTYQGLHTAALGSAWMTLVYGFAGMRNYHGEISFRPYLPEPMDGYQFSIKFKGRHLRVRVTEEGASYRVISDKKLYIDHCGEIIHINPGEEKMMPLRDFSELPWRDE